MGRSNSCLRILTCAGGDSAEKEADDLDVFESKSSNDKRGWSFRKKSARHRVLSNTVISETTPISANKATLESALLSSPLGDNSTVPEKVCSAQSTNDKTQLPVPYVVQPTQDKAQLPVHADLKASETNDDVSMVKKNVDTETSMTDDDVNRIEKDIYSKVNSKESETDNVLTIIEKDIGCRVDEKVSETDDVSIIEKDTDCIVEDNLYESVVIVIQAVVRGFLARRELLKLKKVVRLQAAVRGHLVRRNAIGALRCVQAIVKMQVLVRARRARLSMEDTLGSVPSQKENSGTKPTASPASLEKMLQNKFARQLMASTPMTEPIRIKCDPSKPNSAWSWLERWMSVSSAEKTSKPDLATEQPEEDKAENVTSPVEISSNVPLEITDSKSMPETSVPLESEENVYEADKMNPHEFQTENSSEQPHFKNVNESEVMETSVEVDSHLNQSGQSEANELSSLPKKAETESEQLNNSIKRKASGPAFIAAQSRFEELTSSANSNKSVSPSSYRDVAALVESKTDRISSTAESKTENDGRVWFVGSECDTELSISSTLESTESEVGAVEYELETKLTKQETHDSDKIEKLDVDVKESTLSKSIEDRQEKHDHAEEMEKPDVDVKESTLSNLIEDRQEKLDHGKDEVEGSVVSEIEQKQEISTPMVKKYSETETGNQIYPLSPESQATPASNVSSVKPKKDKMEKSGSNQKRKVTSSKIKSSPSNPKHDSGGVSSAEQTGKDHKSGKRRNSFGIDQEPRESSSGNNSFPRFMQPTESARAKVHEHNSPRSSPDVQERDMYAKKRHSLPGADGKQGSSPRIQRSMSPAQQGTKERKWQR